MNLEIWKDIVNYEEFYSISDLGRFKIKNRVVSKGKVGERFVKEKIVTGTKNGVNGNDYFYVTLSKNGIEKQKRVHIIVAKHFIPNPENKPFVNHKDGIRFNNKSSNLEWSTVIENTCHGHSKRKFKSKYPGVTLIKISGKWQSRVTINKKRISMGFFEKEIDAYNARINYMKSKGISAKYSEI